VGLGLLAGCYDPTPKADLPCGDNDVCPRGQTCVAGTCRAELPDGVDAPLADGDPADAPMTDSPPDACPGGDNTCTAACVGMDPDCITTCGDNRCVGNAGELCGACMADCATTAVVCGNAQCQTGESATSCFADCGPSPWTWTPEEQQLLTLVQNARTNGFTCPGGSMVTRPAFTVSAAMLPAAREWVWEMSHHNYFGGSNAEACNGRTAAQRQQQGGFSGYVRSAGYASVQDAFDNWMASTTLCPIVMGSATTAAIAVSFDTRKAYLLVID